MRFIFADYKWEQKNEVYFCNGGFWYLIEKSGKIFRIVKGKFKKIRHISVDLQKKLNQTEYYNEKINN